MYRTLVLLSIISTTTLFAVESYNAPEGYIIVHSGDPNADSMPGKVSDDAEPVETDENGDFVSWTPKCFGMVGWCWEIVNDGGTININNRLTPPSGETSVTMPPLVLQPETTRP